MSSLDFTLSGVWGAIISHDFTIFHLICLPLISHFREFGELIFHMISPYFTWYVFPWFHTFGSLGSYYFTWFHHISPDMSSLDFTLSGVWGANISHDFTIFHLICLPLISHFREFGELIFHMISPYFTWYVFPWFHTFGSLGSYYFTWFHHISPDMSSLDFTLSGVWGANISHDFTIFHLICLPLISHFREFGELIFHMISPYFTWYVFPWFHTFGSLGS